MAKLTPRERADHAQKFRLRFHNPALYDAAAAVIDAREPGKHWVEQRSEDAREVLKVLLEEEMDERLVEAIINTVAAAREGKKP